MALIFDPMQVGYKLAFNYLKAKRQVGLVLICLVMNCVVLLVMFFV